MSTEAQSWNEMDFRARFFIAIVIAMGASVLVWGALHWSVLGPAKFWVYLLVAVLSSRLKVHLPAVTGTMSVNFLLILVGIVELGLPETLAMGCSAIVVQCFYRDKPPLVRVLFNICNCASAICVAY